MELFALFAIPTALTVLFEVVRSVISRCLKKNCRLQCEPIDVYIEEDHNKRIMPGIDSAVLWKPIGDDSDIAEKLHFVLSKGDMYEQDGNKRTL